MQFLEDMELVLIVVKTFVYTRRKRADDTRPWWHEIVEMWNKLEDDYSTVWNSVASCSAEPRNALLSICKLHRLKFTIRDARIRDAPLYSHYRSNLISYLVLRSFMSSIKYLSKIELYKIYVFID